MKKNIYISIMAIVFGLSASSQTIFKGLEYGMTADEAITEFKKNKDKYDAVDLGNGFVWRTFKRGFLYDSDGLVGVSFNAKGGALGIGHDATTQYLEYTRAAFESKSYVLFFEPDYWQYPLNFSSKYGLLMSSPDKSIMVQLYPVTQGTAYGNLYLPILKVMNYDWFMAQWDKGHEVNAEKIENSGF